ncbi:succinate dehydrogenase, cytochrome b556 subunit [Methylococcus geothermalis]|uniref:Succinate dehydrogenase cytochrome b556 subunit n=1 Tax=Methylococcus geothermalis TaxID=2681310 RepID=A0A858Q7L6_9GAMM|nr:succinate dehydrogenase, cytochrome b556 subunit [Methylococcus geothermalis]QJD29848.1 succinate dehydrogenase, cytochrome b556 subunit [Methylococcus geothermalis]
MERMNTEPPRPPVRERPLSPHLQAYRLPITALLSLTHRVTGVLLSLGLVGLVLVLMSAVQGPSAYAPMHAFLSGIAGRILLWTWIAALLFHLSHGIRHLAWDTGHGFSRESLTYYAWCELAATLVLVLAVAVATIARS